MSGRTKDTAQPTLEHLERQRWQLWLVAGILLLATAASVLTLVLDGPDELGLPAPTVALATMGVAVAFILYALDRERMFRRMTRALFDQHEREVELVTRLNDLKLLVRTSRSLNATLTADDLYGVVLDGAMGITEARRGALFLRRGDHLEVTFSQGPGAPEPGRRVPVGQGEIGKVAVEGDVTLTGDGPSGVCAPIIIRGERVGVLAVERDEGEGALADREVTLVRLFAEQAATAVANATRFEAERSRVEALVDAGESRSDFVARMVHDLRAPLSAISGYSQLIRDRREKLSEIQHQQALDGVVEQAARMRKMIDEVLSAASVEAGAEVRRLPMDLGEVLRDAAATGRAMAESRGDQRYVSVEGDAPGVVHADRDSLRHVFTNLVDNAVKYSPAGSPVVLRVVSEAEDVGDHEVVVQVVDRGIGIPDADLPHVFERFRQASNGRTGVGLGLYIVRTLVRAHGGEINVTSRQGEGSVFTVRMPRRPA